MRVLKKIRNVLYSIYLLLLLLAFNAPRVSACVLLSIVLHESGHALALRCLGKKASGVNFYTRGARMEYAGQLSYLEECFVCFCGPLANIVAALLSFFFIPHQGELCLLFFGVNLFYALTNLLPFPSYDGERILCILLSLRFGAGAGERVVFIIGFFLRCVLLFLSLYLIVYFDVAYQIFWCIFLSFLTDFAKQGESC